MSDIIWSKFPEYDAFLRKGVALSGGQTPWHYLATSFAMELGVPVTANQLRKRWNRIKEMGSWTDKEAREHGNLAGGDEPLNDWTNRLGQQPLKDEDVIRLAEERGYVIHKPMAPAREITVADTSRILGDRVRIAVISDTHFGSKYQQPTLLRQFLLYAKSRGVSEILHIGDTGDGPFRRHHNPQDVWLHTFNSMVAYASSTEALPELDIPYYFIDGNHDDWWSDDGGPIFGEALCAKRDDFNYLGSPSALRRYGDVLLEMFHPNDGGAYALSYKLQRHIEGMSPEEKPNIHLAGNYHKAIHLPGYRNVEGFLVPAWMSRSHWMKGKSLVSVGAALSWSSASAPRG